MREEDERERERGGGGRRMGDRDGDGGRQIRRKTDREGGKRKTNDRRYRAREGSLQQSMYAKWEGEETRIKENIVVWRRRRRTEQVWDGGVVG